MLGSILTDIFSGSPIHIPYIKTWEPSPTLHIPMPQQTHTDAETTLLIIFGGIFSTFTITSLICVIIYRKYPRLKWIFGIPIFMLITEVVSDYYCGTDNLSLAPLEDCKKNFLISSIWMSGDLFVILFFFVILSWLLVGYFHLEN
jgi:hypothetical protein